MKKIIFIQAGFISCIVYCTIFLMAVTIGEFNHHGMFIIPSIVAINIFVMMSLLFWRRPELIFLEVG